MPEADRAIRQIIRLTGVDIFSSPNDCNRNFASARCKLLIGINRQKIKSRIGSARYDSNHHMALLDALFALDSIQNKTGNQSDAPP